jgi:hypothetical protein
VLLFNISLSLWMLGGYDVVDRVPEVQSGGA